MARDERARSDAAGVGPDPEFTGELFRMHELKDFRIAEGEPDVRGWSVCTLNGREVGEVEELLVDPRRGEVVMLEVELKGSDRHAEVPIRNVQIDRERKCVVVDSADVADRVELLARRDERLTDAERTRLDESVRDVRNRDVRYDSITADRDAFRDADGVRAVSRDGEEIVVERRPVVMEEVVVRRRVVNPDENPEDGSLK